jgi:hypothetical protein
MRVQSLSLPVTAALLAPLRPSSAPSGILTGLLVDQPVITILSAGLGGVGLYLCVR